jgi:hypothetical protein
MGPAKITHLQQQNVFFSYHFNVTLTLRHNAYFCSNCTAATLYKAGKVMMFPAYYL